MSNQEFMFMRKYIMIKLLIAGSRNLDVKFFPFCSYVDKQLYSLKIPLYEITEVISGKATGADALGESWAISKNIPITPFPAFWNKYGKSAGPIRNEEMAKYCDLAMIFKQGKVSKGTDNMIENLKKLNKPYTLTHFLSIKEFECKTMPETIISLNGDWEIIHEAI